MGNIITTIYNKCTFYGCCKSKKPLIGIHENEHTIHTSPTHTVQKTLRTPYRKLSDKLPCDCDYHQTRQSHNNLTNTQIRKPASPWETQPSQQPQHYKQHNKSNEVIQKSTINTKFSTQLKPLESQDDISNKTQVIKLNANGQNNMNNDDKNNTNDESNNNNKMLNDSNDLESIALTKSMLHSRQHITLPPPSPTFESQILSESTVNNYEPTVL